MTWPGAGCGKTPESEFPAYGEAVRHILFQRLIPNPHGPSDLRFALVRLCQPRYHHLKSPVEESRNGSKVLKTLITGAAGFIGSHLCEALLARGDEVVAIDDFNDYYDPALKRANVAGFRDHARCSFHDSDVRDAEAVARLFEDHRPEAVAHLAAYGGVRYSVGRASLYTQVNILGSVNVLEAARKADVKTFVFASTSSVYGNTEKIPFEESDPCHRPLAPYPASKRAVELLGHTYWNLHELNFTALRFFSVYGPRGRPDMMPYLVTDRIVRGEEITLYNRGKMRRDWTYVGDIVQGIVSALETPLGYEVLNLGRGEPVWMIDFVKIVEDLTGKKAILDTPEAPPTEPAATHASIERAREKLGYDPQTSLEEGLARLWAWYQERFPAKAGASPQ